MLKSYSKIVLLSLAALAVLFVAAHVQHNQALPPPAQAALAVSGSVEFCILFGINDSEPTTWDGSISAQGARVSSVEGWRLDGDDRIDEHSWKLSTRKVNLTRGLQNQPETHPMLPNGVFVTADLVGSEARFTVETSHGDFTFAASEVPFGEAMTVLGGRAVVERVPVARRLTTSIEEQDFPAVAQSNGTVYLAYVEFTHGRRSQVWPRQLEGKPESFAPLRRPAGGDQVMLMEYSKASRTWSEPEPISQRGQDVYRTAVAVDGDGRPWVIWSAQIHGNDFELFARYRQGGHWSEEIRLTDEPGPDLYPVAATDSTGQVWVAWQGYRDNFEILAARQEGDQFGDEVRVSESGANDWAPQIAAGSGGRVAVAWDTYHKGDYDVYLRQIGRGGSVALESPAPVAASHRFEARPSLIFDSEDRIWVAYESGFRGWGKDYGAYETTGTGLYQGHTVEVKVLGDNKQWQTADALDPLLKRQAPTHPWNKNPYRESWALVPFRPQPDPTLATNRPAGVTGYPRVFPAESHPRLGVAANGTIVLAFRNVGGNIWGPLGTTWFENVAYFDGENWTGPIFVANSDGILDQRPAFVPLDDSTLLMLGVTDYRFTRSGSAGDEIAQRSGSVDGAPSPEFNYDVIAHELRLPGSSDAKLTAIPAEEPAPREPGVQPELNQVSFLRNYRVNLDSEGGNEELRLLRGEFHRHTAVSGDGAVDGDLVDAWRYMLDAAYMDWFGCCDHDNGNGREYTWWLIQKMTDAFNLKGRFVSTFSYERSVRYPEGHRNVIFAERGIRALPRLPRTAADSPPDPAPDTEMLYEYLRYFDGITAVHTSATNMGTDWRNNDPEVEPAVEIYQGDRQNYEMPGAPRSNSAEDSIGGWRPLGFVSKALEKGYRLGFQASSDHVSTHMSYCNLWVTEPTREAVLEAFKKRRIYGSTDNILADVRCGGHFMGEEFSLNEAPKIDVKLVGTAPFAKIHIIKDGQYVYSIEPGTTEVAFSWRDNQVERDGTSYYYVRGEQTDGELVWVSPMWIKVE